MAHQQTLLVAGRGAFPVDMLRYDCCWPASEVDSSIIARSLADVGLHWCVAVSKETRRADPTAAWTFGRWESFAADVQPVVSHHDVRRLRAAAQDEGVNAVPAELPASAIPRRADRCGRRGRRT